MYRKAASKLTTSLLIVAFALVSGVADAATDMFLKIDDIKGESIDSQHRGEIDVLSLQFGDKQQGVTVGAGSGAGKAQFEDVTITKRADRSSPILAGMVASGKPAKLVTIVLRKAGNRPINYIELQLTSAIVSGYQASVTSGSDVVTETVTFHFEKIKMTYYPQKADGSADTGVVLNWDVAANRPL